MVRRLADGLMMSLGGSGRMAQWKTTVGLRTCPACVPACQRTSIASSQTGPSGWLAGWFPSLPIRIDRKGGDLRGQRFPGGKPDGPTVGVSREGERVSLLIREEPIESQAGRSKQRARKQRKQDAEREEANPNPILRFAHQYRARKPSCRVLAPPQPVTISQKRSSTAGHHQLGPDRPAIIYPLVGS